MLVEGGQVGPLDDTKPQPRAGAVRRRDLRNVRAVQFVVPFRRPVLVQTARLGTVRVSVRVRVRVKVGVGVRDRARVRARVRDMVRVRAGGAPRPSRRARARYSGDIVEIYGRYRGDTGEI